jgi:dipeptidyl aminopeptidase/acylaminoacyl peptidase
MVELSQLLRVRSASSGRFDASGRYLVFVADLAGVPQVWGVQLDRPSWPELLVAPPDRAQMVYVGPRSGQLVVGADVGGDEHTQLLYQAAAGEAWQALTDDRHHIFSFDSFAPDGRQIAFSSNTRTGRWFDVSIRDLDTGETRTVLQDDSTNHAGPFSPDGRWLIVKRSFSNTHDELWLLDLRGSVEPRLLTDRSQEARYDSPHWTPDGQSLICVSDVGREYAAPVRLDVASGRVADLLPEPLNVEVDEALLDPSGRRLVYATNRDGAAELVVRVLATGQETEVRGLPPGALYTYWQPGLAWDPAGERIAISWTASRLGPNVFVASIDDHLARQVTAAGGLDVDLETLVEPQHVTFPTFDGRQIPALYYPASADGDTPPPCVIVVHGGPEGQFRPTFQPVVHSLVASGLAVLAPNVRGSTGYGTTYVHLDDVRRRMDSVNDLAHAATWLGETGRADRSRIAVYGGSYGGFMVLAALTTYPDLWAAGVDLVGIANFVTFLENTGAWRRHLREAEYGSLARDREFLTQISPINHVEQIRAPLFIVHGANDPRVPISETEQMVARLQSLGRTVEFLRLEDEGHQIAKLKNKLVAYPRAVQFLQRHLRAGTVPASG